MNIGVKSPSNFVPFLLSRHKTHFVCALPLQKCRFEVIKPNSNATRERGLHIKGHSWLNQADKLFEPMGLEIMKCCSGWESREQIQKKCCHIARRLPRPVFRSTACEASELQPPALEKEACGKKIIRLCFSLKSQRAVFSLYFLLNGSFFIVASSLMKSWSCRVYF